MNGSTSLFSRRTSLLALLPFVVSFAACSDDEATRPGLNHLQDAGGSNVQASATAGTSATSVGSIASIADAASTAGSGSSGIPAGSLTAHDAAPSLSASLESDATANGDSDAARRLAAVHLGAAGDYVVLAESTITNVPTSLITGLLGLSPAGGSSITGFALTRAGSAWTSPQVIGSVFSADNDAPTSDNLTTAVVAMLAAYSDAETRALPDFLNLEGGQIGGLTLAPGLYKWASSVEIDSNLTFSGSAHDVWILQISGDLVLAAAKAITLSGGAQARNIYWQVAGSTELGSLSHSEGVILSKTAIHLATGASLSGRLLAQTAVTLDGVTITAPAAE
jgi:hypothetical protein